MRFRRNIEFDFQKQKHVDSRHQNQRPFISSMNLQEEYVTLVNPQDYDFDIEDYVLTDGKKMHQYVFPKDSFIPAGGTLHVYTCPGKVDNHDTFIVPYVLWMNLDGSLRKKEVLNNG